MELKNTLPIKTSYGYSLISNQEFPNSDCQECVVDYNKQKNYFSKLKSTNKLPRITETFEKIKSIFHPLTFYLIVFIIMILTLIIKHNFHYLIHTIFVKKHTLGIFIERLKDGKISKEVVSIANELSEYYNVCLLTGPNEKNEYILKKNIKRVEVYSSDNAMLSNNVELAVEYYGIDIFLYNRVDANQIKFLYSFGKKIVIIFHDFYINYIQNTNNLCGLNQLDKADLILNFYPENLFLWNKKGLKNAIYIPKIISDTNTTNIQISNLETKNILLIGDKNSKFSVYNFKHAINIMKMVINGIKDALLQILYNNEDITELKKLVNKYKLKNNVKFYKKADKEKFYRNASIFLQFTNTVNDDLENLLTQPRLHQLPIILIGREYFDKNGKKILNYDFNETEKISYSIINLFNRKYYRTLIGRETMLSPSDLQKNKKKEGKYWSKTIEKVLLQPHFLTHFINNQKNKFDIKSFVKTIKKELAIQKPLGINKFDDLLDTLDENKNCENDVKDKIKTVKKVRKKKKKKTNDN